VGRCGDDDGLRRRVPVHTWQRYIDWDPRDPKNRQLDEVRGIRDEIERRIEGLVRELDAAVSR
jgi:protein-tyrosine-phosphatase